jgi:hypothetical protein
MKNSEGLFRLVMLTMIVALSYVTPTPVRAEPSEYCPWVEADPGDHSCTCGELGTTGQCLAERWECTLDGWEVDRQATIPCDECDDFANNYCSNR